MLSGTSVDRGRAEVPGIVSRYRRLRWGIATGTIAALAVLLTLEGPGLTVDEPLDVRPGRKYVHTLFERGWRFLTPEVVDQVYRDNAEHPPLGRWLLGIASVLGQPFETVWKGPDPTDSYVLAGRIAPALTFGALAGLIAFVAIGRWGKAAGLSAALALVAMPRVFAHAHFGALDTFLAFTWTAALLAGERALRSSRPVAAMSGAGLAWALALLTKIHAWFLLPILAILALVRLPIRRAIPALAAWSLVGCLLFWAGWPWLWYHPWSRLLAYWGTGVERSTILVQYFGRVYADRDVPWHYPWFYFVTTVPIGLHAFGLFGLVRGWRLRSRDPLPMLLAGSIAFFLVLFSSRVPVYDGERLFLLVFPAWAMLLGFGCGGLFDRPTTSRPARIGLFAVLSAQLLAVVLTFPFGLSYYNGLVAWLPGADRLGLEVTYWGDAVDRVLLDDLAARAEPDATAALVPTLYPGQGTLTTGFHRGLARRGVILKDQEGASSATWVVLSRRSAYWPPGWTERLKADGGRLVATRRLQGVVLAELWYFPRNSSEPAR